VDGFVARKLVVRVTEGEGWISILRELEVGERREGPPEGRESKRWPDGE